MASGGDGAPNNRTSSGHGAWPSHHELSGCRLTPCHAGHVQLQPSTQDQAQTGPKALVNMRRSLKKKKISALVSIAVAQASHCGSFSCCRAQVLGCPGSAAVVHWLSCPAAHGIFPDQGSNPCPLHWQVDSYPLSHQRNPWADSWYNSCSIASWGVLSGQLAKKRQNSSQVYGWICTLCWHNQ